MGDFAGVSVTFAHFDLWSASERTVGFGRYRLPKTPRILWNISVVFPLLFFPFPYLGDATLFFLTSARCRVMFHLHITHSPKGLLLRIIHITASTKTEAAYGGNELEKRKCNCGYSLLWLSWHPWDLPMNCNIIALT